MSQKITQQTKQKITNYILTKCDGKIDNLIIKLIFMDYPIDTSKPFKIDTELKAQGILSYLENS